MNKKPQGIQLKAIIPLKFCVKFDPPKIGLLYKRNPNDKNRIYEILLEKYLSLKNPEEIAKKIFSKHSIMINEKTIKLNQLINLVMKIQKNVQSSSEKQNVQLYEDSSSGKKRKDREEIYKEDTKKDQVEEQKKSAANKLIEQEKNNNKLNFAKKDKDKDKDKDNQLNDDLIEDISNDFNIQKGIKNNSGVSKNNNDNLFGESQKSDFLKESELDEIYQKNDPNAKSNNNNNNIISEQDLNDIALEIDQMFSDKRSGVGGKNDSTKNKTTQQNKEKLDFLGDNLDSNEKNKDSQDSPNIKESSSKKQADEKQQPNSSAKPSAQKEITESNNKAKQESQSAQEVNEKVEERKSEKKSETSEKADKSKNDKVGIKPESKQEANQEANKFQMQNEKLNQKIEQLKQNEEAKLQQQLSSSIKQKIANKQKPNPDKSIQEKNRKMFQYYWEDYFNKGAKRNEQQLSNDMSKLSFKDIISLTIMAIIQQMTESQKSKISIKVLCENLQNCCNLKNLEFVLAGIILDDSDLIMINQTLKVFEDIECLIIQFVGNQLTTQSILKLDFSDTKYTQLQEIHLDFHQNKIGTDCLKNVSKEFKNFVNLRILDINLEDNQIGNIVTEHIEGFLANDKIQLFRINLSNNLITNQGVINFGLALSKHGQTLRRLDYGLGANMIDNSGIEQLGTYINKCLDLSELTLALQDTQVTEQGAFKLLYGIFNLRFLYECNLILDEPLQWISQLIKQVFYVLNDYKRNFIYQVHYLKNVIKIKPDHISDLMQFYFQKKMIPFEDQSEEDQLENMTPEEQLQYKKYLEQQQKQYMQNMDDQEKDEYLKHLQRSSKEHQQIIDEYDENLEDDQEELTEEQLQEMYLQRQQALKSQKQQIGNKEPQEYEEEDDNIDYQQEQNEIL